MSILAIWGKYEAERYQSGIIQNRAKQDLGYHKSEHLIMIRIYGIYRSLFRVIFRVIFL